MTAIITPIAAVDAIQRVPVDCWIGPWDNGGAYFPNYPVWCDNAGQPVDTLDKATHALWDGAFGTTSALLLAAIGRTPPRSPPMSPASNAPRCSRRTSCPTHQQR